MSFEQTSQRAESDLKIAESGATTLSLTTLSLMTQCRATQLNGAQQNDIKQNGIQQNGMQLIENQENVTQQMTCIRMTRRIMTFF
jgi:hypothetical protein